MSNIKKIINAIKNNRKLQYILVGVIIVVLLILYFVSSSIKTAKVNVVTEMNYVSTLEKELSTVLSKIKGVGNCSVKINIESGTETVIAKKTTTTTTATGVETVETPILVDGKTVTLKEIYPKVTGVLIVADGANNFTVYNKIMSATCSLFNIKNTQVEIFDM